MLNKISSLITPEIYQAIYSMGHLDELSVVDGNYCEKSLSSNGRIFLPIYDNNLLLTEILKYFPLDEDVENPVHVFLPDYFDHEDPPAWDDYQKIIDAYYGIGKIKIQKIDRDVFYRKTRESYATIKTLDHRVYANIIIRKGFVLDMI